MGSMNFAFFGMLNRFKKFDHEWERKHVENKDIVFRNTFQDIEFVLKTLSETGTRFEFECYDTAHLYNLDYFLRSGLVKPPLFVQTVFGLQGGTGAHPEDVLHMKRTADRLFGDKFVWSVLGAGAWTQTAPARFAFGVLTFGLVCIAWVFFRAKALPQSAMVLASMMGAIPATPVLSSANVVQVVVVSACL